MKSYYGYSIKFLMFQGSNWNIPTQILFFFSFILLVWSTLLCLNSTESRLWQNQFLGPFLSQNYDFMKCIWILLIKHVYNNGKAALYNECHVPQLFQALTTSAHSVVHHGIPLQAGTAHFGCGDAFQQTLIICPPALQGILLCKLLFESRHLFIKYTAWILLHLVPSLNLI